MRANQLSAVDAARQLAGGELTSEALVRACLERIDAREDQVQAWEFLDRDHANVVAIPQEELDRLQSDLKKAEEKVKRDIGL